MNSGTPDFDSLPSSIKVGAGAGGGGVLAVLAFLLGRDHWVYLVIVVIGLFAVIALLLAWRWLSAWQQAGKSANFNQSLGAQLRRAPQAADADSRAKLDDLRRKLQEGINKLNSMGKSVYVLPWYLMVGEPGSGKTKAVSAAGIALPGFQDPLQGSGGTVNMNWWFTNSGIILDTAGRLMLPEVATSNNPEWDTFLQTLNKQRPDCPINGLILAIPADTLITDTAEEIERKAGEIAFQFNKIQATLGIRFPVFVVVTKCDKILGFREFFEGVTHPDEQAQILGWSNPDKLDDPFRPELLEQHLQEVRQQLMRRRLKLLQDPVHSDDPALSRLEQVDALYELPDELSGIAPRLRRYLELIFIGGPLSRPLFLRGIYFTSSLQTGEALDKAFAQIMGGDLAAGRGEPIVGQKTYFLRHMFNEKVFQEKGLVTRTNNVSQLQRGRKLTAISAGFVGAAAMLGFSFWGYRSLEKPIRDRSTIWEDLKHADEHGLTYTDDAEKFAPVLRKLEAARHDLEESSIEPPWIFKPFRPLFKDPSQARAPAFAHVYHHTVLRPLLAWTSDKMRKDSEWSSARLDALQQLIVVEMAAETSGQPNWAAAGGHPISALGNYLFSKDDPKRRGLQSLDEELELCPPSQYTQPGPEASRNIQTAVERGVSDFAAYFENRHKQAEALNEAAGQVIKATTSMTDAESKMHAAILDSPPTTREEAGKALEDVGKYVRAFNQSEDDLRTGLSSSGWTPKKGPFVGWCRTELSQLREDAVGDLGRLLRVLDQKPFPVTIEGHRGVLNDLKDYKWPDMQQSNSEPPFLAAVGSDAKPMHEVHAAVVKLIGDQLQGPDANPQRDSLATLDEKLSRDSTTALGNLKVSGKDLEKIGLVESAKRVIELSAKAKRYDLIVHGLNGMPEKSPLWEDFVAASPPGPVDAITVPLARFQGSNSFQPDPKFDPDRLSNAPDDWKTLSIYFLPSATVVTHPVLDVIDQRSKFLSRITAWTEYCARYKEYWNERVPKQLTIATKEWPAFQLQLKGLNVSEVDTQIHRLVELQSRAIRWLDTAGAVPLAQTGPEAADEGRWKRKWVNWANLPPNSKDARRTLLTSNLDADYLEQSGTSLYQAYWHKVFVTALSSIAADAMNDSKGAITTLGGFDGHFPLGHWNAPFKELTPKQLKAASDAIDTIRGASPGKPLTQPEELSDEMWKAFTGEGVVPQTLSCAKHLKDLQPLLRMLTAADPTQQLQCKISFQSASCPAFFAGLWRDQKWLNDPDDPAGGGKPVDLQRLNKAAPVAFKISPGQMWLKFNRENVHANIGASYQNPHPLGRGVWSCLELTFNDKDKGRVATPADDWKSWYVTCHPDFNAVEGSKPEIAFKLEFPNAPKDLNWQDLVNYWSGDGSAGG